MQIQIVGICWYQRESYARILEIMEDREKLPNSYDRWIEQAEHGLKHMLDKGIRAIKVDCDPGEFLTWCRARGLHVNANSRMEFAASRAAEAYRKQG